MKYIRRAPRVGRLSLMNEVEANQTAEQRNREAGQAGQQDEYWIAVELEAGVWTVEHRKDHVGFLRKVWRAFLAMPGAWP